LLSLKVRCSYPAHFIFPINAAAQRVFVFLAQGLMKLQLSAV